MKHTPEPWTVDGTKALGAYGIWTDYAVNPGHDGAGYPDQICRMDCQGKSREERDANAARIVAAVNACRGLPTESLTDGVVLRLVEALREMVELIDAHGWGEGPSRRRAVAVLAELSKELS